MRDHLAERYSAALEQYLDGAGEEALSLAYELGREGLRAGRGVLDLLSIHHASVVKALAGRADAAARRERAAQFLAESLSPFEMALRAYASTLDALQSANATLASRNQELHRAKASAEAANHELESFSYSVAHDLRAPLRSIDGFSQVLLEDSLAHLDEEGKKNLQRVRAAAQRMGELIDDLLELSRVNRRELRRADTNLAALCREVLGELRRGQPDRSVELVAPTQLVVHCDPRLMRVVLVNLLGNAWKFCGRTAAARIELGIAGDEEGRTIFFVRDNGAGFDMAYAGKLFAPFQRLHSNADFPGTGIGLATVQRVVQHHGGRVWAEAKPGQGATFFFTLVDAPPG